MLCCVVARVDDAPTDTDEEAADNEDAQGESIGLPSTLRAVRAVRCCVAVLRTARFDLAVRSLQRKFGAVLGGS